MYSPIIKHQSSTYDDPLLSSHFDKMHSEFYQRAILLGQLHAFKNSPPPAATNFAVYTNTITANYNSLLLDNHSAMQAHLEIQVGSKDYDTSIKDDFESEREVHKLVTENKIDEGKLSSSMPILSFVKFSIGVFLTLCIGLAELYLISLAFQIFGKGLGASMLFALGLCTAMIAIAHLVPLLISHIRSISIRKLVSWVVVVLMAILFWGLAVYRNKYIEHSSGVNTDMFSNIFFVVWNMSMMVSLYLVAVYLVLPSWKDIALALKVISERRKVRKGKRELAQLIRKRNEDKLALVERLNNRLAKIAYAKANEEKVYRMYKKSIAGYIEANYLKRIDGIMPECFSQEPPPLQFFYTGISLSKNTNS